MSNHRDDDLEPALRAMLGDRHLDVRARGDAVDLVLAGVGRARRRRTTGYAAVSTFALAAAIGAIAITGSDTPQGIDPVVPPTSTATQTSEPTETPASTPPPSVTPPSTAPEPPPTSTDQPVLQMLTANGIGDLLIGMTVADAYGTGTLWMRDPITLEFTAEWDGTGAPSVCEGAGIAQRSTPDGAYVWMDDTIGVAEIAIWPESSPDVTTPEGLKLGDPFDRVAELYPDARRDDSPNSNFFVVENWGGTGNVLKIRDDFTGQVRGMSVHSQGGSGCYE